MRLLVLVPCLVAALACGGFGEGFKQSFDQSFDQSFRQSFTDSCAQNGAARAVCACTADELVRTKTPTELMALTTSPAHQADLERIMKDCVTLGGKP